MMRMSFIAPAALFALVMSSAGPAAAQQALAPELREFVAVEPGTIALRNVRIIDGTGAQARDGLTIVIDGDRIRAVGPAGAVEVPRGARVLDLQGHTVIPGLVGLHNHTFYTAAGGRAAQLSFSAPRLYLASGVTTIRTTGARAPYEELNLKHEIESGREIGPTMFVTGPYLTGEQGSMTMTRLGGPSDARRVARYWSEEGVSWLKAYTWITRDELGAVIDEAHRHGVKVTAHLCSVTYREAVALGIDNLEHGLFANTDYHRGKRPDECPTEFRAAYADLDVNGPEVQATFRDMIENDVAMSSTLAVYAISVPGIRVPERHFEILAPEIARDVRDLSRRIQTAGRDSEVGIPMPVYRKAVEYELAFFRAGGLLGAGVDPTGYGAAPPGFGDQWNYELLVQGGFAPQEAIRVMSANGARILDIGEDAGTIEPGKIADLVVLEGDPVRDGHIRNVRYTFKQGVGWDSPKIVESVRGVVGIR